jgi:acetylornithine deacetylase/succinyl-diaminopimelate desuccinylase-like protein
MNRQALNDSDKAVRDWFISRAEMIGCHVSIDEIGNIFAIMPGKDNTLDPIGMGSHLDTQPNGKVASFASINIALDTDRVLLQEEDSMEFWVS